MQWALNSAFRDRLGTTPFHMMTGWPPPTVMSVLVGAAAGEWTVVSLDASPGETQKHVIGWISEQEAMRSRVVEWVRAQRQWVRELGYGAQPPSIAISDYVLVTRVRNLGSAPKLVPAWTSLLGVLQSGSTHVYALEDIITGKTQEVHVVRTRAYANSSLVIGWKVQGCIRDLSTPGRIQDG